MPTPATDEKKDPANGNAPGGRAASDTKTQDPGGIMSQAPAGIPPVGSGLLGKQEGGKKKAAKKGDGEEDEGVEGFGLGGEDVKGSLKIHIKLDLEADIRVLARVRGDIAIGLL